jgi:hypothetical protein
MEYIQRQPYLGARLNVVFVMKAAGTFVRCLSTFDAKRFVAAVTFYELLLPKFAREDDSIGAVGLWTKTDVFITLKCPA